MFRDGVGLNEMNWILSFFFYYTASLNIFQFMKHFIMQVDIVDPKNNTYKFPYGNWIGDEKTKTFSPVLLRSGNENGI